MGFGGSLHAPVVEIASALGGARPVEWSRVESGGYGRVSAHERVTGSFLPAYLGFHDQAETLLVLEDLSAADWPPPWSQARIDAVLAALRELHATEPPEGVEPLDAGREVITGWGRVADDPE